MTALASHCLVDLPGLLDRAGPAHTPHGAVRWERAFPMAGEELGFCATTTCDGTHLDARVVQHEAGQDKEIFAARWTASQGSWVFARAHLDDAPQAETQALAIFADYLRALAADPLVEVAADDPVQSRRPGPG